MEQKDLIQLIRDNPGCHAVIDNDTWTLYKSSAENPYQDSEDDVAIEKWDKENELCSSDDIYTIKTKNSTYQENNCYGGGLLRALAEIVGITTESV